MLWYQKKASYFVMDLTNSSYLRKLFHVPAYRSMLHLP